MRGLPPHIAGLLALLRALSWNHLTSHWQVDGDTSYGDHQLFDRIYGSVLGEIDTLAEKMVSMFGARSVDAREQARLMTHALDHWDIKCPFERSLVAERALQIAIQKCVDGLEAAGQLSFGMDDFLRTLANSHETNIYLLQQRLGGVRVASATASTKQTARRLRRAYTARATLRAISREPNRFLRSSVT